MLAVFVSSQNVRGAEAAPLIERLKMNGFAVEHSPENPITSSDPKWKDWYEKKLDELLERSEIFIFVIDGGWDSSTWMAIEAERALRRKENGKLRGFFCHNPRSIPVVATGMKPYLSKALPINIPDAAKILQQLST